MHRLLLAAALMATASPAFGQISCKLQNAIYAERDKGYEIRFRVPKSGELMGMTESLFDLVTPDGRKLWGEIASNMGTSRDVGRVYFGCQKPKPGGPHLTEEQIADCQQSPVFQ